MVEILQLLHYCSFPELPPTHTYKSLPCINLYWNFLKFQDKSHSYFLSNILFLQFWLTLLVRVQTLRHNIYHHSIQVLCMKSLSPFTSAPLSTCGQRNNCILLSSYGFWQNGNHSKYNMFYFGFLISKYLNFKKYD